MENTWPTLSRILIVRSVCQPMFSWGKKWIINKVNKLNSISLLVSPKKKQSKGDRHHDFGAFAVLSG